jgi:glucans biosynthesis protein
MALGVHAQTLTWTTSPKRPSSVPRSPTALPGRLPPELAALSYDQARDIRWRPERALWRAEQRRSRRCSSTSGYVPDAAGAHHELRPKARRRWPTHAATSTTAKPHAAPRWGDLGFAGFRIHHPLNSPPTRTSWWSSRAPATSARWAPASSTACRRAGWPSTPWAAGEEFPRFPSSGCSARRRAATAGHRVCAAGIAARHRGLPVRHQPGAADVTTVRARMFLRAGATPSTLGIAPLTSMFMSGENQPRAGTTSAPRCMTPTA